VLEFQSDKQYFLRAIADPRNFAQGSYSDPLVITVKFTLVTLASLMFTA
jgi:hypothetical protein